TLPMVEGCLRVRPSKDVFSTPSSPRPSTATSTTSPVSLLRTSSPSRPPRPLHDVTTQLGIRSMAHRSGAADSESLEPPLEERHGKPSTVGTGAVAWKRRTRAGSYSSIADVHGSRRGSGQRTLDDHNRISAGKRRPGAYASCAGARLRVGGHHRHAG